MKDEFMFKRRRLDKKKTYASFAELKNEEKTPISGPKNDFELSVNRYAMYGMTGVLPEKLKKDIHAIGEYVEANYEELSKYADVPSELLKPSPEMTSPQELRKYTNAIADIYAPRNTEFAQKFYDAYCKVSGFVNLSKLQVKNED